MADEVLSGIYAMALFRVARRAEKVRQYGEDLSTLGGLLGRSERLRKTKDEIIQKESSTKNPSIILFKPDTRYNM